MLTHLSRRAAFGAIASLGLLAASANALTLNAAGGPIADGGAVVNGAADPRVTLFKFIDDNTPQTISSIETVTLTGLTHAYSSDLAVLLVYFPDDVNAQGKSATLFSFLNNGGTSDNVDYYGNDFNGNYSFSDDVPAANTLQASVGANDDNAVIVGGTFRPSDYYIKGSAAPIDNLDSELGGLGLNLAVGSLYLYVIDYSAPDAGSLGSGTITLTTALVPEPTSLSLVGLGAAMLLRRRRA